MYSGLRMALPGLMVVFNIYLHVARTDAVYLPVYDRWARQRLPTSKDDNLFQGGADPQSATTNDDEIIDNMLIDYITSPTRQCDGVGCVTTQRIRLTICGTGVTEDCVPVTWDDFVCTSTTSTSGGLAKQRCRIAVSDLQVSQKAYAKASAPKQLYVKKWDDNDKKLVPF